MNSVHIRFNINYEVEKYERTYISMKKFKIQNFNIQYTIMLEFNIIK